MAIKDKIKIVTDTTTSLTPEECEKRGIALVATDYILDDVLYSAVDEPEVSFLDFYKKLDTIKSCSTGCVNELAFEDCFEKYIAEGYKIVYVGLSSGLSSTYSHAEIVAKRLNEKYGKKMVATINSRTASYGTLILIDDINDLINQGKNIDEIEFIVSDYALKLKSSFVCRDLSFLHKSGRINAITAGIGSLLRIVPIVSIDETDPVGKLKISEKCMGAKLASKTLKTKFVKYINDNNMTKCKITSCGLDAEVEDLKNHIQENTNIKDIETGLIDKTLACCCGPKTIAIFVR